MIHRTSFLSSVLEAKPNVSPDTQRTRLSPRNETLLCGSSDGARTEAFVADASILDGRERIGLRIMISISL